MRNTNRLKLVHPPPTDNREVRTLMIHSGLTVTVVGYLLYLDRDEHNKQATVKAKPQAGVAVTGVEQSAVRVAADLLAERARRFFGKDWQVNVDVQVQYPTGRASA